MVQSRLYAAPGLRFLELRPKERILESSPGSNAGFSLDTDPYSGGWEDDD